MSHIVLSALLPVALLIAAGFALARLRWVGPAMVKPLSTLAFMVLTPVLLFRTMSRVHVEQLELQPAVAYMATLTLAFISMFWWRGFNRSAAVLALAVTYSNAVMIGIPLVSLAWGEAGLVTLFTLIPIHSLVLLTVATMALEIVMAHEAASHAPDTGWRALRVGGKALGRAVLHPVPLPIILGLLFAQTGWVVPAWLDTPMAWMGKGFGPLALLLVGIALAGSSIGTQLRPALALCAIKNLAVPLVTAASGLLLGIQGLPLLVLVVTAALPIGANVFLFSQRYGVAQELITASVALSTVLAVFTVPMAILLVGAI